MLVMNWMSRDLITVDVGATISDAADLLERHNIRELPVMKNGRLKGMVTDRDLKKASPSDATILEVHELPFLTSRIKVEHIMAKDPITVPADYTVEEAAEVLLENRLSGAPVVQNQGRLVGIITKTDILKVLISLKEKHKGPGTQPLQGKKEGKQKSGRDKRVSIFPTN